MGLLQRIRDWYDDPPRLWRPEPPQPNPPRLVVVHDSPPRTSSPIPASPPRLPDPISKLDAQQVFSANVVASHALSTQPIGGPCLQCRALIRQLPEEAVARLPDFVRDLGFVAADRAARLYDGQAAYKAASPYIGHGRAAKVGSFAAKHSPSAAKVGIVAAVLHTKEAYDATLDVVEAEAEGNIPKQAKATATFVGAAGTALLSAGVMFALPVAIPALVVVGIGSLIAVGSVAAWKAFGQKPASKFFENYINGSQR